MLYGRSTDLPSFAFPPPAQELMRALEEVNASLERFSGVNRKALDQYIDFSNQREELVTRKQEQVCKGAGRKGGNHRYRPRGTALLGRRATLSVQGGTTSRRRSSL